MALASVTLVGKSQHSVKYRIIADGAGGVETDILYATLIADAADGPLKSFLLQTYTAVQWAALTIGTQPKISLFATSGLAGTPVGVRARLTDNDAVNVIRGTVSAANGVLDIELRFNHTRDR